MRYLLLLVLLFSQHSYANDEILKYCEKQEEVTKSSFLLFNKKDLIRLGTCVGKQMIMDERISKLSLACNEKTESLDSPLKFMGLSKAEAIRAGMCVGAIGHVYERFNNEYIRVGQKGYSRYERKVYRCKRGPKAIGILVVSGGDLTITRSAVRDLLCLEKGRY